jgi:hypothetical protein
MELCFQLVTDSNLETMARELLQFLGKSEPEVKTVCASNLVSIAERYAPSPSWHFHMLLEISQAVHKLSNFDVILIYLVTGWELYARRCGVLNNSVDLGLGFNSI